MGDEPTFFGREAFGGRFWSLVAAIVFVVAVAAGGIVVAATGGSSASPSHKAAGPPGGCPLTSVVSDTIPTAAPPQTTWVDVRGFKLPVSPDGPAYQANGAWGCYAHSPAGALESVMGTLAGALVGNRDVVAASLAPGTVSSEQLASLVPAGGEPRQPGLQVVGFIFGRFSRQGGQVAIVDSCTIASCTSPFYSTQYEMTWAGRWLITNDGGATTPLQSASGVTTWEAP